MLGKITDAATSARWRDAINALHAGKSIITKTGVDEYPGASLNKPGLEPKKLYKIYRPPEVLKEALPLMKGLRILDGHYFETSENLRNDKLVGAIGDSPELKDGALYVNVTIWPQKTIDEIESGEKEQFSLGYSFDVDMTPGTTPDGRHYDGRFTKIIPEHVALVPVGRVNHPGNTGPLAKIADEADMNFQEAMTAICQTCPDTPADVVRAAVMRAIADLNTKEAQNGPEPGKVKDEPESGKPTKEVSQTDDQEGLVKKIADAVMNLFSTKEPKVADEDEKLVRATEERRAREMLHQMRDKPKEKVLECLDAMGLTDAAKRTLKEGSKGEGERAEAHQILHEGLFGDGHVGDAKSTRITGLGSYNPASRSITWSQGLGRGGWNHIAMPGGGSGGGTAHDEDENMKKERIEREDRMAKDILHHLEDAPKDKVRSHLESLGLTEAAKRVLGRAENDGKAGDARGYKHTQNDLFGGVSTNTISGGGHGRGGCNHDSSQKTADEDKNKAEEDRYDAKEDKMKANRKEAKELLDKGLHEEAVKTHLMKARGLSGEEAEEMVERARYIPASELPKGKTKDEEEAERKAAIAEEVKRQRKTEEEERQKADKARDEVEKETGRLHGCKVGDSAEDMYRAGLASLGFMGADTLPTAALESTFRSFAAQRRGADYRMGDSAFYESGDVHSMAADLIG